uniref:Uncharacterized protein n=1 Tax=Solanum lycopersicum TaxID=4081 RepID=A0A3Q7ENI4_SOLLC
MFFSFHLCVYFRCINRDNLSFYIFCSTRAEKEHIQNKRRSRRFSVAFRRTVYVQDEEPPSALHCYPTKPRNMPPNLFIGNGRQYGKGERICCRASSTIGRGNFYGLHC